MSNPGRRNKICCMSSWAGIWDLRVRLSDWIGMAVFSSFGLWWATFPASVIRFYTWFHRGTVRLPEKTVIRIIGLAEVALVVSLVVFRRW